MRNPIKLLALAAIFAALSGGQPRPYPDRLFEASGVYADAGEVFIVDDSVPGAYFKLTLSETGGVLYLLDAIPQQRVDLANARLGLDLESIDRLADGRVVVLSEQLRSLIGEEGQIAEYDYQLAEMGRRGLEGLAVRPVGGGASRVAVLWEGGYPDFNTLNPQIEAVLAGKALRPMIFIHDVPAGRRPGMIRWDAGLDRIVLQSPLPDGDEPDAQRFRAPDIVWTRMPGSGPEGWGFIAIISSQNMAQRPRYVYHWLQRFDFDGAPVGDPIDIDEHVPDSLVGANWEGLAWWKEGSRLLLVNEGRGKIEPHALLVDLPEDWRYDPGP